MVDLDVNKSIGCLTWCEEHFSKGVQRRQLDVPQSSIVIEMYCGYVVDKKELPVLGEYAGQC